MNHRCQQSHNWRTRNNPTVSIIVGDVSPTRTFPGGRHGEVQRTSGPDDVDQAPDGQHSPDVQSNGKVLPVTIQLGLVR